MAMLPKIGPRPAGSTNRSFASVDPERQRGADTGRSAQRESGRRPGGATPAADRGDGEGGSSRHSLPQHR